MSNEPEASDHYFSGDPKVASNPRDTTFVYANRKFSLKTDRGVFSYGNVDQGTQVLLDSVDVPAPGLALDIGCGAGTLALALASHGQVTKVFAVDTNTRALELTRINAEANGVLNIVACAPADVPTDVIFKTIWSNPPIRIGKNALHELLLTWLPRLAQDGTAWLVVQKNLGADSLQRWLSEQSFEVLRVASRKGFRVFRVSHARTG